MNPLRWRAAVAAAAIALTAGACGGGEDRPGQVTTEHDGSGSGSGSGTGSGSGSGSGSGAGGEHEGHDEKDSAPAFAEGQETTVIDVTLQDYAFVGVPDKAKGPNVLFNAIVKGSNTHEIEVRDAAGTLAGAIHGFKAGETKKLAVALQPGTYTLQCLIKEGARTHASLGMKSTLIVE